ncbi:MAG TPA: FkbM family methyltransferase, partial [Rhodothermales bacterium]
RYARLFPNGTIYAVEPLPANVARMHATIRRHRVSNVRVIPVALSDTTGSAPFHVSSGHPEDRAVSEDWDYGNKSSSLLSPDLTKEVHPWIRFDNVIEVRTATLADICEEVGVGRIDFIHLDVQGAELKVLAGAGDLMDHVTGVWLEVERIPLYRDQPLASDVERFLRGRGFSKIKDTVGEISGDQLWIRGTRHRSRLLWLRVLEVVARVWSSARSRWSNLRSASR